MEIEQEGIAEEGKASYVRKEKLLAGKEEDALQEI